jgi:hypothetical protein
MKINNNVNIMTSRRISSLFFILNIFLENMLGIGALWGILGHFGAFWDTLGT